MSGSETGIVVFFERIASQEKHEATLSCAYSFQKCVRPQRIGILVGQSFKHQLYTAKSLSLDLISLSWACDDKFGGMDSPVRPRSFETVEDTFCLLLRLPDQVVEDLGHEKVPFYGFEFRFPFRRNFLLDEFLGFIIFASATAIRAHPSSATSMALSSLNPL